MIAKAYLSCLQVVPDHETKMGIAMSWEEVLADLPDEALMPCFAYAQKNRKDTSKLVTASDVLRSWPQVKHESVDKSRKQFFLVKDCPRCGYGTAFRWKEKFDRFVEALHRECQPTHRWLFEHGLADPTTAQMATGIKTRMPLKDEKKWIAPPTVDVYPVSRRKKFTPAREEQKSQESDLPF